MDEAKAAEILEQYLRMHQYTGDMTPDEVEALQMGIRELKAQAHVDAIAFDRHGPVREVGRGI